MADKVKDALRKLDRERDDDWTEGGLPSLSKMRELTGDKSLSREDISKADPGFTRDGGKKAPGMTKAGEGEGSKAGSAGGDAGKESRFSSGGEAPDPLVKVAGIPDENQPAGPGQHPGDRPIEDQGIGNPNDAANNADRRDPAALASGGITGLRDDPEYASAVSDADPAKVGADVADPILLLEAVASAAGHGRYARNSALQTVVRAYQVAQREIKEIQARLDQRAVGREERREVARNERRAPVQPA